MENTTFVSAGAGSGKIYRLTSEIVKAIKEKAYRGDEFILTTFTEAAASELREKVRSALYKDHLYDAAINIDNSAIGTIHSIAYQFVSQYWYLLGISPNMRIMSNEEREVYANRSLVALPEEDDLVFFDNMVKMFNVTRYVDGKYKPNPDFWKDDLNSIIGKMVEMRIDEEQLETAKDESIDLLGNVFNWKEYSVGKDIVNAETYAKNIAARISENAKKDKEAKLNSELEKIEPLKKYNEAKTGILPIYTLYKLAKDYAAKPPKYLEQDCGDELDFFRDLLEKVPASKEVREMAETYIEKIFNFAKQWCGIYRNFKAERCVLDYNDLLAKFDELLGDEMVVAELKSRYKMALIDEFQDCSPLQVSIFDRLSEIMDESIWVGDIKQAIYAFRGTNTALVKNVIDEVSMEKNGNDISTLEYCWRSSNTVINIVNTIFTTSFSSLKKELIELGYPPKDIDSREVHPKDKTPICWHLAGKNQVSYDNALAAKIKDLVEKSGYAYSDIAVLYRNNTRINKCAKALKNIGIPVNVKSDETDGDPISDFITAIISLAAYPGDNLSKAIVVNKIEDGRTVSNILSDRLEYLASDDEEKAFWLSESDIINRLANLRKTIGNQSVRSAVETIIVELNILDVIKKIDPNAQSYKYCSALLERADEYENHCLTVGYASTLTGFTMYVKENPIAVSGDDNGVTLTTYHSAKGLEWPCVILCSLDEEPVKDERLFWGVMAKSDEKSTQLRVMPSFASICTVTPEMRDIEFYKELNEAYVEEHKRLMYVGMTRAKEQLIVTIEGKKKNEWFDSIGYKFPEEVNGDFEWAGKEWKYESCEVSGDSDVECDGEEIVAFKALKSEERKEYAVKNIAPSMVGKSDKVKGVGLLSGFGERFSLIANDGKDSTIGNFVHHLMYLWRDDEKMSAVAENLAEEYGVSVCADKMLPTIRGFWQYLETKYGKPTDVLREVPFTLHMDDGRVVNGEIDLIYRTEAGDVLVDYKTYQGAVSHLTEEGHKFNAMKYGGQIELYRNALACEGRTILDNLICYMSLGTLVKVEF